MQIFITDWWMCPELYLRRPFHLHASSRLDYLLEERAKEGVQVHLYLYLSHTYTLLALNAHTFESILNNLYVYLYPEWNWFMSFYSLYDRYTSFYTKKLLSIWKLIAFIVREDCSMFTRILEFFAILIISQVGYTYGEALISFITGTFLESSNTQYVI